MNIELTSAVATELKGSHAGSQTSFRLLRGRYGAGFEIVADADVGEATDQVVNAHGVTLFVSERLEPFVNGLQIDVEDAQIVFRQGGKLSLSYQDSIDVNEGTAVVGTPGVGRRIAPFAVATMGMWICAVVSCLSSASSTAATFALLTWSPFVFLISVTERAVRWESCHRAVLKFAGRNESVSPGRNDTPEVLVLDFQDDLSENCIQCGSGTNLLRLAIPVVIDYGIISDTEVADFPVHQCRDCHRRQLQKRFLSFLLVIAPLATLLFLDGPFGIITSVLLLGSVVLGSSLWIFSRGRAVVGHLIEGYLCVPHGATQKE